MDEALAVAAHPALGGAERGHLLRALTELSTEESEARSAGEPRVEVVEGRTEAAAGKWPPSVQLSEADERFVTLLMAGLAGLARSLPAAPGVEPAAVRSALEGAEFVARREIRSGRSEDLPEFLPTFAYLVALPLVGQAKALAVLKRATGLLQAAPETP